MALIPSYLPPSQANWSFLLSIWQMFPAFTIVQWFTSFYPMGKTSIASRFNFPGKVGWVIMEAPGFMTLLYIMFTLPKENKVEKLPTENWLMAILFSIHYTYRALISPLLLNPSMSPIHITVFLSALTFNLCNATCFGGWLAAYGPVAASDWQGRKVWIELGMIIFALGFAGNIYHDDELREIRRAAARKATEKAGEKGKQSDRANVDKVYQVPENGLFRVILYPHFFCEWIEWCGFWMIGGLGCVPARCFVINEIAAMLPRALRGKQWYIERFGEEKIGARKAVIPGLL